MKCKVRFPSSGPMKPPPFSFGSYMELEGDFERDAGIFWVIVPQNCTRVDLRGRKIGIHLNTYTEILPENDQKAQAKAA